MFKGYHPKRDQSFCAHCISEENVERMVVVFRGKEKDVPLCFECRNFYRRRNRLPKVKVND